MRGISCRCISVCVCVQTGSNLEGLAVSEIESIILVSSLKSALGNLGQWGIPLRFLVYFWVITKCIVVINGLSIVSQIHSWRNLIELNSFCRRFLYWSPLAHFRQMYAAAFTCSFVLLLKQRSSSPFIWKISVSEVDVEELLHLKRD